MNINLTYENRKYKKSSKTFDNYASMTTEEFKFISMKVILMLVSFHEQRYIYALQISIVIKFWKKH